MTRYTTKRWTGNTECSSSQQHELSDWKDAAHLCCNLRNLVQSVHHVVQQLELILAQAAEKQGTGSTTRLDDVWDIL